MFILFIILEEKYLGYRFKNDIYGWFCVIRKKKILLNFFFFKLVLLIIINTVYRFVINFFNFFYSV